MVGDHRVAEQRLDKADQYRIIGAQDLIHSNALSVVGRS
jgi:hypothetical protein